MDDRRREMIEYIKGCHYIKCEGGYKYSAYGQPKVYLVKDMNTITDLYSLFGVKK